MHPFISFTDVDVAKLTAISITLSEFWFHTTRYSHSADLEIYYFLYSIYKLVGKIAKSDYWFRHVCLSVCPTAWNNFAPNGRIFIKFGI